MEQGVRRIVLSADALCPLFTDFSRALTAPAPSSFGPAPLVLATAAPSEFPLPEKFWGEPLPAAREKVLLVEQALQLSRPLTKPMDRDRQRALTAKLFTAVADGKRDKVMALLGEGAEVNSRLTHPADPAFTARFRDSHLHYFRHRRAGTYTAHVRRPDRRPCLRWRGVPGTAVPVSTGRQGFRTPTGSYVVTDKHRKWRSTLYPAEMPYFMRLSCGDIGFHQGNLPGYPASHRCIRMRREDRCRFSQKSLPRHQSRAQIGADSTVCPRAISAKIGHAQLSSKTARFVRVASSCCPSKSFKMMPASGSARRRTLSRVSRV